MLRLQSVPVLESCELEATSSKRKFGQCFAHLKHIPFKSQLVCDAHYVKVSASELPGPSQNVAL